VNLASGTQRSCLGIVVPPVPGLLCHLLLTAVSSLDTRRQERYAAQGGHQGQRCYPLALEGWGIQVEGRWPLQ
jgi:hypothetical protein